MGTVNPRQVAERFRSGKYTPNDTQLVKEALDSGNGEFLDGTVRQYINHVDNIDHDSLVGYLKSGHRPYAVSQIIAGLSYRKFDRPDFVAEILRLAAGADWDTQDIARLAALFALPRTSWCTREVKSLLQKAYRSENPVIRDATLTVAQIFFGIPNEQLRWGKGGSDMTSDMPRSLLEWLNSESH
jgi:hypothetical protein